jgi:hypothetical protein
MNNLRDAVSVTSASEKFYNLESSFEESVMSAAEKKEVVTAFIRQVRTGLSLTH